MPVQHKGGLLTSAEQKKFQERLVQILDTDALDALRETGNSIATLELRASGRFV